jgi:putative SOS response-associated peptidase YedK
MRPACVLPLSSLVAGFQADNEECFDLRWGLVPYWAKDLGLNYSASRPPENAANYGPLRPSFL